MTALADIVSRLEGVGGRLELDGGRILYRIPTDNPEAHTLLEAARTDKKALLDYLRMRASIPAMPPGVRLIQWSLKEPPVCLEAYSLVTDTTKFVQSTLGQIQRLLEDPGAKVGWTLPQLIDRLAQVGVIVAVDVGETGPGVNLKERPRRPRRYY
jgi:hypothetical protein